MNDATQDPNADVVNHDVTPDALLKDFRGKPLSRIILFTVMAHVVFIGLFSIGYLSRQLLAQDTSALTDSERMDQAVREGTTALREIADRHNVSVQELSRQFAGGTPKTAAPAPAEPESPQAAPPPSTQETPQAPAPAEPASQIEQTLREQRTGPAVPDLSADEDDDLFAPAAPQ